MTARDYFTAAIWHATLVGMILPDSTVVLIMLHRAFGFTKI